MFTGTGKLVNIINLNLNLNDYDSHVRFMPASAIASKLPVGASGWLACLVLVLVLVLLV